MGGEAKLEKIHNEDEFIINMDGIQRMSQSMADELAKKAALYREERTRVAYEALERVGGLEALGL